MEIKAFTFSNMTKDIVSDITKKVIEYFTMEKINVPEFLNTIDKYRKVVRESNTMKKYEDIFYLLLEDSNIPLVDMLKIMYNLERDVILVHGISEVKHLMEMAESLIRYLISTAQQEQYEKDQQSKKEVEDLNKFMNKDGETCNCFDFDE